MNITEAISTVKEEQSVFPDVNTAVEAVQHVLNTMVTQEEAEANGVAPGAWVLDGPDPDHPQFDAGYYAHKMVIEWYRMDISLLEYLIARIDDEVGDGIDKVSEGIEAGVYAGLRAARMVDNHDEDIDLDTQAPASQWSEWLGDADPAAALDMEG